MIIHCCRCGELTFPDEAVYLGEAEQPLYLCPGCSGEAPDVPEITWPEPIQPVIPTEKGDSHDD
jgi:hypothetical protein